MNGLKQQADVARVAAMRDALQAAGLDALVCHLPENVLMLSGHWPLAGISRAAFFRDGPPTMIVPHGEEQEAAEESWVKDIRTFRFGTLDAPDPAGEADEHLRAVLEQGGRGLKVGFEGSFTAIAPPLNAAEPAVPLPTDPQRWRERLPKFTWVDATALLDRLKLRKTPREIELLARTCQIAGLGVAAFRRAIAPGRTESELVGLVQQAIMAGGTGFQGARAVRAFPQVSSGTATARGWRPCVHSSARPLQEGDVVMLELAVVADGFWCDVTRCAAVGRPNQEVIDAFAAVDASQQKALETAVAGVSAGEVDTAARRAMGPDFLDGFLHVTGHGLGFRYHEPEPLLAPGSAVLLEVGMVHSVEPGVYLPGRFGLRIEDNVAHTSGGPRNLTEPISRDLACR